MPNRKTMTKRTLSILLIPEVTRQRRMEGFISLDQVKYTFYIVFLKNNVYVNMTKASFSGSKNQ